MSKGGMRINSGPKRKYNEHTKMVAFRCPESKIDELKKLVNDYLDTLKVNASTIKVSDNDNHFLLDRKYSIKKIGKKAHVCRTIENARGKFNMLLAQDILGFLCEIDFVDGDTLNCRIENLRPINREVEFIY